MIHPNMATMLGFLLTDGRAGDAAGTQVCCSASPGAASTASRSTATPPPTTPVPAGQRQGAAEMAIIEPP
jgi:hypothetical protein